jgi:hypothetical protein
VPASCICAGVRHLIAALVAQKMKAGVSIVPCGVVRVPSLALDPSVVGV